MRIVKATPEQKAEYARSDRGGTAPLYPLYGYVADGDTKLPIEYLGEGRDGMDYEIMAPDGFRFVGEYTHSLLCADYRDLRERARAVQIEPCPDDCECKAA